MTNQCFQYHCKKDAENSDCLLLKDEKNVLVVKQMLWFFSGFVGKTSTKFVMKYHQNPCTFAVSMEVFLCMKKSLFGKVGKAFQSTFFQMKYLLIKISEFRKVVETNIGEKGLKFHNVKSIFA